jgi:hypothetical protein
LQKHAQLAESLEALAPQRELVARQQEAQARISGLDNELQLLQVGLEGVCYNLLRHVGLDSMFMDSIMCLLTRGHLTGKPAVVSVHTHIKVSLGSPSVRVIVACNDGKALGSRSASVPNKILRKATTSRLLFNHHPLQVDAKSSEAKAKGAAKDIAALTKVGIKGLSPAPD